MRIGILVSVFALLVTGYFGAIHFFSVPQICGCQATTIPANLMDEAILENSIGDANTITVMVGDGGSELTICYLAKPAKGNVDTYAGLSPPNCKYENGYRLEKTGGGSKTDNEALLEFEITDHFRFNDPRSNEELSSLNSTSGELYINRSTNACKFRLSQWRDKHLSGRVECGDPVFYFNPWSWFPQTVELFYTRAFFFIHSRPPTTPANSSSANQPASLKLIAINCNRGRRAQINRPVDCAYH